MVSMDQIISQGELEKAMTMIKDLTKKTEEQDIEIRDLKLNQMMQKSKEKEIMKMY